MKTHNSMIALVIGSFISAGSLTLAHADKPLVPSPSILDFTSGSGWGIGLGVGVEYEAAYDGSDEYDFELDPAGAVQWRSGDDMFFWEGTELGWRGLRNQRSLIQAGIRYETGLDPDESEDGRLAGIAERDSHTVGFVEVRQSLDDEFRNWIGGRLMGGPSDFGWLGVVAAGHRYGDQTDGTGSEVFVFATFGDSDFINKDFGIGATDAANSGLQQIEIDSGYRSTGITYVYRRDLSDNLQLLAQAGAEFYSSDIKESDIARNDYETEVSAALIWRF